MEVQRLELDGNIRHIAGFTVSEREYLFLVLENTADKQAHLICWDLLTNTLHSESQDVTLEQQVFTQSLFLTTGQYAYFTGFRPSNLPEKEHVFAYNMLTCQSIWQLADVQIVGSDNNVLYVGPSDALLGKLEPGINASMVAVSLDQGEPVNVAIQDELPWPIPHLLEGVTYSPQDPDYQFMVDFLAMNGQKPPVAEIAYVELQGSFVMAYPIAGKCLQYVHANVEGLVLAEETIRLESQPANGTTSIALSTTQAIILVGQKTILLLKNEVEALS